MNAKDPAIKKWGEKGVRYVVILIGILMNAYGISAIYVPNQIVCGGVSGVATILFHLYGISPGITFLAVNAVLLGLSLIWIGKAFVWRTVFTSGLISFLVGVFGGLPPLTNDIFLATVAGSLFYGGGIALVLVCGAATGGTDILGRLIQCAVPQAKIGTIILTVDIGIVLLSLFLFGNVDLACYGMLALVISNLLVNGFIKYLNSAVIAIVVMSRDEELRFRLSDIPAGKKMVVINGGETENKKVILCTLMHNEVPDFEKRVEQVDEQAIVILAEAIKIKGDRFRVYR